MDKTRKSNANVGAMAGVRNLSYTHLLSYHARLAHNGQTNE